MPDFGEGSLRDVDLKPVALLRAENTVFGNTWPGRMGNIKLMTN